MLSDRRSLSDPIKDFHLQAKDDLSLSPVGAINLPKSPIKARLGARPAILLFFALFLERISYTAVLVMTSCSPQPTSTSQGNLGAREREDSRTTAGANKYP